VLYDASAETVKDSDEAALAVCVPVEMAETEALPLPSFPVGEDVKEADAE